MFLNSVSIKANDEDRWPWTIPALKGVDRIDIDCPVTFFVGENGSGKSTLLESLAIAYKMPSIGRADAHMDDSLTDLREYAANFKFSRSGSVPVSKFFLRSEDFFSFLRRIRMQQQDMNAELERIDIEYEGRSDFARLQARTAFLSSLSELKLSYGEDLLHEASHGESFLRLFERRIVPKGLYFLDEPETPLSPVRQMALLKMISDSAKEGSQFIIATHSPILTALPEACIMSFDTSPMSRTSYEELESVQLLMDFARAPQRFIRHLLD